MKRIIWLSTVFFFMFSQGNTAPFSQKLIYTDTPEIGEKWQFGIRMSDIIVWDLHFNVNSWFMLDFLGVGLPNIKGDNGEEITDVFSVWTIKSLPYKKKFSFGDYALSGGLKIYNSKFEFKAQNENESFLSEESSGGLFLTQGLIKNNHTINLFTSLSSQKRKLSAGEEKDISTIYFVPGYQYKISKGWRFNLEYFLSNTERLPLKILQYGLDVDKVEFQNVNQEWISFTFWGFSYLFSRGRIDIHLGNHISFSPPFIPVIGFGWDF